MHMAKPRKVSKLVYIVGGVEVRFEKEGFCEHCGDMEDNTPFLAGEDGDTSMYCLSCDLNGECDMNKQQLLFIEKKQLELDLIQYTSLVKSLEKKLKAKKYAEV